MCRISCNCALIKDKIQRERTFKNFNKPLNWLRLSPIFNSPWQMKHTPGDRFCLLYKDSLCNDSKENFDLPVKIRHIILLRTGKNLLP